jgi:hypothetical protein
MVFPQLNNRLGFINPGLTLLIATCGQEQALVQSALL